MFLDVFGINFVVGGIYGLNKGFVEFFLGDFFVYYFYVGSSGGGYVMYYMIYFVLELIG